MTCTGYTHHDRARRIPERGHPYRDPATVFDHDRGRLLASGALHRLSNITQVDEPDAGPVPHNRLTHSLTVATLGRRIALGVGADPILVETGCLAHDLGHPPFGHNGEMALRTKARGHGLGFEANAQTLRILTRLEPSHTGAGLNLTRASLDATCKYPWTPGPHRKYGAYPDDADTLAWVRHGAPERRLCVEAQIMDTADDIANAVTDLTAGLRGGAITLAPLTCATERTEFAKLAHGHFTTVAADDIDAHTDNLLGLPAVAALTRPGPGDPAAITELEHTLTARFTSAVIEAIEATKARSGPGPHHRFTTDLVVPAHVRAEIALLKALHLHFVLRAPGLRARRAWQRHVINTVFDALLTRPDMLEPRFAAAWTRADTDDARVRVIVDQVAAYTDRRAVEVLHKLTGEQPEAARVTGDRPPVPSPGWQRPRAS
ncbi:deoxyguanosinetriphosphate triphosphohydrolase [Nocardia cyriacigeorgica]|uniref:deoxyguanosinetriphosphate triphosphohydrolase n=1 Tax=Nocardia cyriacigeorgica TaxID=135487 RepID=UPI0024570D0A|nr:deoxyguanosinetriphosphate triphosphohydrolase [Nocardia cyriacigeorgica]